MSPSQARWPGRRNSTLGRARRSAPRPAWARRRSRSRAGPQHDWVPVATLAAAGLPGLAALIALIFSYQAIKATGAQLQVAEQGQITDRYNAAIANLGSRSIDIRLGGIYALQRLMQDSHRDQPTVISVLCAYVRDRATAPTSRASHLPTRPQTSSTPSQPPTDIQAVLTVVATRNTGHDGSTTVVDFTGAQLAHARLPHAQLANANLNNTQLFQAYLPGADLIGANLFDAKLVRAYLPSADLHGAGLGDANLTQAFLFRVNLIHSQLGGANFSGAVLTGANLSHSDVYGADFTHAFLARANLSRANLDHANLSGANLSGANLSRTNLSRGDLTNADLTDADLTGAIFYRADLTGANFYGADLTGARWPADAAVPKGWIRGIRSGRLTRAS
jgi:uncharacterized protein YjbI with pentapeptide repeats